MKIQQTSETFKALHMPPLCVSTKVLGVKASMKAEKARNELTKLAQDVDIFIKPVADENKNIAFGFFHIDVKPINYIEAKKGFLDKIKEKLGLGNKTDIAKHRVFVYHPDLDEKLVQKTEALITELK